MKVCISFVILFCQFTCGATTETGVSSKIIPSIQYVDLQQEYIEFIEQSLAALASHEAGRELIQYIRAHLRSCLQIKSGERQAFKTPKAGKTVLTLTLNFKELIDRNMKSSCLGAATTAPFIPIGESSIPFYIVLGHELLHLKHYLENKEQYEEDSVSMNDSYWPITEEDDLTRANLLWHDLEEQRTVIGKSKEPEICELTLRKENGIAPRYAYQDIRDHFYEDRNIIERILLKHDIDIRSNNLFIRDGWHFDSIIAEKSRLNPNSYKQANSHLYATAVSLETPLEIKPKMLKKKEAMLAKLQNREKKE